MKGGVMYTRTHMHMRAHIMHTRARPRTRTLRARIARFYS